MDDSINGGSPRSHSSNGSSRSRKKPKAKAVGLWGELEASLGLHGIRRVKPKNRTLFFSILWCLILVAGLGLFTYELAMCLHHYFRYNTSWEVEFVNTEDWPALTICSLNPVRVSQLATNYWAKDAKGKLYKSNFNWETFLDERYYLSSQEFFLENSHTAEDLIVKCEAGQLSCAVTNFSLTLTEHGLCYKLKPDRSTGYLNLVLNAETYEYTAGLTESTGFKVYVHDLDTVPIRDDTHAHLFPGHHFEMTLGKEEYRFLDAPYGSCNPMAPDTRTCLSNCYVDKVGSSCQCRAFWFPSDVLKKPECEIRKHFTCVMDELDSQHRSCYCPTSCQHSTHSVQLASHPVDLSSLYKIMSDDVIDSTLQRFQQAKEIQMSVSRTQRTIDEGILKSFLSIYSSTVSNVEEFERDLYKVKTDAQDQYTDLKPRLHFHTDVALKGIQMTIEKGYSAPWRIIEEKELHRISSTSQELIHRFNVIITRLRFTTAIEFDLAKLIYTLVNMELSVNTDLTAHTLDNITSLYYAFLDAIPIVDFEITPDKMYDSYLIPSSILIYDREVQRVHYSGLSNTLGLYIDDILKLRAVLKGALLTRQYNETAYMEAKDNFIQHSTEIDDNARTFRKEFITRCEMAISDKIEHVTELSNILFSHIDHFEENVVLMENFLSSVHLDIFHRLKHFESMSESYLYHSNVTRSELVDTFNTADVQALVYEIDSKIFELRMRQSDLIASVKQLQHSVIAIWQVMFGEELLRSFYLKLSNDVMDMIQNPKQTTYFMKIFTDPSLLNMTVTNKTDQVLERFFVLLNADLHSRDFVTESERVNQTFVRIASSLTKVDGMVKLLKQIQGVLSQTNSRLMEVDTKTEFTNSFARENLLSVTISKHPTGNQSWTQKPAYTIQALLVDLGSLLAFILGASVLTFLEFCDILLAWIADRFFSEGKKATREIPPEYRDKIKSRESLGSSRASMDLNNSLNSQKRSYVTFRDFNNVNGSEV